MRDLKHVIELEGARYTVDRTLGGQAAVYYVAGARLSGHVTEVPKAPSYETPFDEDVLIVFVRRAPAAGQVYRDDRGTYYKLQEVDEAGDKMRAEVLGRALPHHEHVKAGEMLKYRLHDLVYLKGPLPPTARVPQLYCKECGHAEDGRP